MEKHNSKSIAATISVVSNLALVVGKLLVGLLIGSVSVLSEAIHSGVDLLAAIIALIAVRTSKKPADLNHPYGHGKIENIAGVIEAFLIFLAAGWIIREAILKLIHHEPLQAPIWGIVVMCLSTIVNLGVSSMLFKVGKATESMALQADAWHLRTDVWTSLGVMGGLLVIVAGRRLAPGVNLDWVDPVAAIVVAMLILKAAWELTVIAGRDLLDTSLPGDEEQWIRTSVTQGHPQVCSLHQFRSRKTGPERFIEFHLVVAKHLSVEESHAITDEITRQICQRFASCHVIIHVEPCDAKRCPTGTAQCPMDG